MTPSGARERAKEKARAARARVETTAARAKANAKVIRARAVLRGLRDASATIAYNTAICSLTARSPAV